MSDRPEPDPVLSVVIAASGSPAAVARSAASLSRQGGPPIEVIVASGAGRGVPRLRRLGLDAARGEVVVFTEDSCVFPARWVDAWVSAFDDPRVRAATGPVVPAMGAAPADWAVFFCEYAPFLPGSGRSPSRLAGNNFAVRRASAGLDSLEIHESDVYRVLSAHDHAVVLAEGATAHHVRRYAPAEALRDRLRFGFDYGRRRAGALPRAARLAGFAVGPLILLAQAARLTWVVLRRGRFLGEFLENAPLTLALLTAWSVGEWLGWVSAAVRPPGASRRRRGTAARPHAPTAARPRSSRPRYTAGPRSA